LFLSLRHNVFDVTLTNNFQYQSQFVDIDKIIRLDQIKDVQIAKNYL